MAGVSLNTYAVTAEIARATVKALDHLATELPQLLEIPEPAMMALETGIERALARALHPPQKDTTPPEIVRPRPATRGKNAQEARRRPRR